jgi:P4 family phage/plasmid primase-like protien
MPLSEFGEQWAQEQLAAGRGGSEPPPPVTGVVEPLDDDAPPPTWFFDHNGLRALTLADTVMRSITCGFGAVDERFCVYGGGVWTTNNGRIEAEIGRLLGNRYRHSHARNAMDLIRYSPSTTRISCDPVEKYINVVNGMVDWSDGTLHPHSPDYRSTVQLPVEYDPTATCPEFERFLADVLPADCWLPHGDSPGFIWELLGYTLFSGNPLHVAVLLFGKGRNGKGTLIRVLKRLLGERNYSTVGLHELTENRFRTANLFGKLANLAGDLDSRWLDNTATFKAITGGDSIQGEYKYGAVFDFAPWALPFYSANKAFGSADSSEGWVARWVVVPFPISFIGREDRNLDARIQTDAELRGILRRGIEALPVLMKRGRFAERDALTDAKTAFITASDAVRSWLGERCVLEPDEWTPRTDLYQDYRHHTSTDGSKVLSARELYNRIEQVNGIRAGGRNGVRGFSGVRLLGTGEVAEVAGVAGTTTPKRLHRGKGIEAATSATWPTNGQVDEATAIDNVVNLLGGKVIGQPDKTITSRQMTKLAILRDSCYPRDPNGRAAWFAWVETNIKRHVGSNRELTKAEASTLIDVLEAPCPRDDTR